MSAKQAKSNANRGRIYKQTPPCPNCPSKGEIDNWRMRSMSGNKRTGTEAAFLKMLVALIIESVQPNIERTLEVKINDVWNKVMQIINPITARLDAVWEKTDKMFGRLDDVQNTLSEAVAALVTHDQLNEALANIHIEEQVYKTISEQAEKLGNLGDEVKEIWTTIGTHAQAMNKVKEGWNEYSL
tara:strand:- start:6164 stop:6718 length:555 start_codon:yes stop_codon:yes gene_type:complete